MKQQGVLGIVKKSYWSIEYMRESGRRWNWQKLAVAW